MGRGGPTGSVNVQSLFNHHKSSGDHRLVSGRYVGNLPPLPGIVAVYAAKQDNTWRGVSDEILQTVWSYIRLSWSRSRAGDLDGTRGCKVRVVGGMIRAVSELQGRYSRAQQILLAMRRGTSRGLSLLRQHEPGERQVLLRMWSQTTANFR